MSRALLILGDALLDRDVEGRSDRLCPDAPVPVVDQRHDRARPGGAGLAALLAAQSGIETTLVTALGRDAAGQELARALLAAGIELIDLGLAGSTPEKIRVLDRGRPLLRLDRGGGRAVPAAGGEATVAAAIRRASAILVSDYGNGIAGLEGVRAALVARGARPLVWDPHPRGPEPPPGVDLVTPNHAEALARCGARAQAEGGGALAPAPQVGDGSQASGAARLAGATRLAAELRRGWRARAVAVTCGSEGAALAREEGQALAPSLDAADGDPCGAGDRFAVEAAWTLGGGGDVEVALSIATAQASSFVARGGAHALDPGAAPPLREGGDEGIGEAPLSIAPAIERAAAVRRAGGTVVATGGCFDLLHTGHLQTLRAARGLGDCLIVLLNGDRSVRRLKGPRRPMVGELERAELLAALDCVDAVAIFDEETPTEALRLLRPDVWVKGGDYAAGRLPEREALASWGGRVALLPFLQGKSTTDLIQKAGQHD